MENIKGKVVIITGASSGIGKETALLLAKEGAKLVLGARRAERLQELVKIIVDSGGEAIYQVTDVAKKQEVHQLVDKAIEQYGRVDVLFNNAGVMPLSYVESLKVDEWEKMIDINLKGVLYGIAAVMPYMLKQGDGHIITNGSVASYNSEPTGVVYSATKFGVRALHEGMRKELNGRVRLSLIAPGMTETELGSDITEEQSRNSLKLGRVGAISPKDIAEGVAFAISRPKNVTIPLIQVSTRG
ncbi:MULTISPECIES: SDR family oxidoreductase [Enterococcus]|uniref:SDR family oxidoreductase n=1 Tax=Enterococcus TaxID=1350 RepID=UPI00287F4273|nr:SDR family oxidoreductase [Enterococcus faecium]